MGKNNQKGFTLVEVLVATFIAALVIVGVTALFLNSVILNSEAKYNSIASEVAQDRIEALRNMTFTDVSDPTKSTETNTPVNNLPNGQRTTTLENSYGADIKKLTVTVNWTGRKGPRSISLTTLVSKDGLVNQ